MNGRIATEVAAAGIEALRSGWLTMGPRTETLERALGERLGAPHVVATSSGTAGLHLSCLAAGIADGKEILVPAPAPRSCSGAPDAAAARVGSYGLFGVDPDPERILAAAGADTVAVLARHPLGFAAELGPLAEACSARDLLLIEDCRDALGASAGDGTPVGGAGDVMLVSFSAGRQVDAGEGGAVLTADEAIAAEVRSLRSHAMTSGTWDRHRGHAETYDVVGVGFNYRIDEVRAAMATAGLARLDREVADRRARAEEIVEVARGVGGELVADARIATSSPVAVPLLAADPDAVEPLRAALERADLRTASPVPAVADADPDGAASEIASRLLVVAI